MTKGRPLTADEDKELDMLAFIVVADLSMTEEQYQRYNELKRIRDGD